MADNDLDYGIWPEDTGEAVRFAWEVVRVDDDGNETQVAAGMEETEAAATVAIGAAMRANK
jgi:hypothetical protein